MFDTLSQQINFAVHVLGPDRKCHGITCVQLVKGTTTPLGGLGILGADPWPNLTSTSALTRSSLYWIAGSVVIEFYCSYIYPHIS